MRALIQPEFSDPQPWDGLRVAEESLVIHQRSKVTKSRQLVVFVHGLGGRRYGSKSTWGRFPQFVYEDLPAVDVGMYQYRSLMGRIKFWKSVDPKYEAKVLGDILRSLRASNQYDTIVLVGHSMGGLMCKGAVAHLLRHSHRTTLERVRAVVLMATPQLGSLRGFRVLATFNSDARVLQAHNEFVAELVDVFREQLHCAIDPPLDSRHHLVVWAVLASGDRWVDPLSAGINIGPDQQLSVSGSHTSIVKPDDKGAEAYQFVRRSIEHALRPPEPIFRTETYRSVDRGELGDIHTLARQFFGDDVSPLDQMLKWWDVNSDIFFAVERVVKRGAIRHTQTVGYFCVIPLTVEAASAIRSGAITGAQIEAQHVAPADTLADTMYIGAVAAVDFGSRGSVMHCLREHLGTLAAVRDISVLTRPVTEEGLRQVTGYSFQPVPPHSSPAIGVVHEMQFRQLKRVRRTRSG